MKMKTELLVRIQSGAPILTPDHFSDRAFEVRNSNSMELSPYPLSLVDPISTSPKPLDVLISVRLGLHRHISSTHADRSIHTLTHERIDLAPGHALNLA